MKINKSASECCGCSACSMACPVGAITMQADAEGFLYPVVNETVCVDCSMCVKACSFDKNYAKADGACEKSYYALVHRDAEIRRTSRSGGAFFAMAKAILAQGGVVYGVALDDAFCAKTVRIASIEELPALQGSKYVQSNKGDAFRRVREDLTAGLSVLFSGTGCEVSGLHSYLRLTNTDTARLYTCDIVCHGVPSPLLWKDNVAYMEKKMKGKIDEVSFRDKRFGWRSHIESYRSGKKIRYANRYTSIFYEHLSLRPSCGSCHFCNYDRCGDMTIADFWGVDSLQLPIAHEKGVSLLIIHTERGKELIHTVMAELDLFPTRKEDTKQPNFFSPSRLSPKREQFWKGYEKKGYKRTTDSYYSVTDRLKLIYNCLLRRTSK